MGMQESRLRHFTINNKKFQNKYYEAIQNGIISKYKTIYPNEEILIKYKAIVYNYSFLIYKYENIISESGDIVKELVLLTQYTNINAINIFSDISMEEYLEEYDDSKKDYHKQLIEYIEALMVTYKLLGFELTSYEVKTESYSIFKQNNSSWMGSDHIFGRFNYDIITENEFIRSKRYIRNKLENLYNKYKK